MHRLLLPTACPGLCRIEGEAFHHLVRVLRLKESDRCEVFDGHGNTYDATFKSVGETWADLDLKPKTSIAPSRPPIAIVQALIKADKLEWVFQKCTELGATHFLLVSTQRGEVKPSNANHKMERWKKIIAEAARQCRRADLPELYGPQELLAAPPFVLEHTVGLVLDEEEKENRLGSIFDKNKSAIDANGVRLIVGPEGGLTREEISRLSQQGVAPVTLGPLILRTETAGVAALSVIQHLMGNFG